MTKCQAFAASLALLSLAACSRPTDAPPEPQAMELQETIQAPIRKAEAVEADVLDAAEKQRADIEAATGG